MVRFILGLRSGETTQNMPEGCSFEERVFARFDSLEAGMQDIDNGLRRLEARAFDTKSIWEQPLKEIVDTRRELSKRLDRIEAIAHKTRAPTCAAQKRGLTNLILSLCSK